MKTWKDITLKQAQELLNLGEMDDLDLVINQMAIIKDTTIDEIEKLTPKEVLVIAKEQEAKKKLKRVPIFKGYRLCEVK